MTADLCFTVTNDQPLFLSDLGEPEPGFYDSLAGKPRWALAAAGMGCRLRKVCWPSARRAGALTIRDRRSPQFSMPEQ